MSERGTRDFAAKLVLDRDDETVFKVFDAALVRSLSIGPATCRHAANDHLLLDGVIRSKLS